jgi:hypothetical protein
LENLEVLKSRDLEGLSFSFFVFTAIVVFTLTDHTTRRRTRPNTKPTASNPSLSPNPHRHIHLIVLFKRRAAVDPQGQHTVVQRGVDVLELYTAIFHVDDVRWF